MGGGGSGVGVGLSSDPSTPPPPYGPGLSRRISVSHVGSTTEFDLGHLIKMVLYHSLTCETTGPELKLARG